MTIIYLICGMPASGKSTLAHFIQKGTGATLIQSDVLRHEFFATPSYSKEEHGIVFPAIRRKIRETLARGEDVIYDATNIKEADRKMTYNLAEESGSELKIFFVSAPENVISDRMFHREFDENMSDAHGEIGYTVYQNMYANFTYPSKDYMLIDGDSDHENNVELKEYILARRTRQ